MIPVEKRIFHRIMGPGLDTHYSPPLKLNAIGIRFDRKPENWDSFKQNAEGHAGITGLHLALDSRESFRVYSMLTDTELHAARIS